jgi:cytochrome b561
MSFPQQESTMQLVNTETRYGALPQALHWLTVICVVAGWLLGQSMDDFPKGVARASAFSTHIVLGEFVIILLVARLL